MDAEEGKSTVLFPSSAQVEWSYTIRFRFDLKAKMTREEWAKVFAAGE